MKLSGENEPFQEITIYICSICKDYFDNTTNIIHHLISIHKNEKNIQRLIKNVASRGGNKNKSKVQKTNDVFECNECSYITNFATTMKRHILTHNKVETTYKCSFCSYSSRQSYNLKLHVNRLHADGKSEIKVESSVVEEMLKKYTDD